MEAGMRSSDAPSSAISTSSAPDVVEGVMPIVACTFPSALDKQLLVLDSRVGHYSLSCSISFTNETRNNATCSILSV